MNSDIMDKLQKASDKYGIPTSILYAVAMTESGGDTTKHAVTSTEDSRGLFQVNIRANTDANSSQLFNPDYNISYQVPKLKSTYDEGVAKGLKNEALAQYVEKNGEKPQWTDTVATNVNKYYREYFGISSDGSGETIGTDTENSEGSSSNMNNIATAISNGISTVTGSFKFGLIYVLLFSLLLFSGYIVFIKGGETSNVN